MLSRVSSHPHSTYVHDYRQPSAMLNSQHHAVASPIGRPSEAFGAGNLQAGRKRRESELDAQDQSDANNVRRRISRACDLCHSLRVKCSGDCPCSHCVENGLACEYARAYKKRGRAPKKESDIGAEEPTFTNTSNSTNTNGQNIANGHRPNELVRKYSHTSFAGNEPVFDAGLPQSAPPAKQTFETQQHQAAFYNGYDNSSSMTLNSQSQMQDAVVPGMQQQHFQVPQSNAFHTPTLEQMPNQLGMQQGYGFPLGDDYSVAFMGKAPLVESPDQGWLALTSPMFITDPPLANQPRPPDTLRFPVLRPLLPHIESIMPQNLACDLLELYFASSTSAYLRPSNAYVLGYIFRKKSVLHATEPRPCTPGLLASMLWISAQTSDASFLTSQPEARAKVCQRLLELTINMLKPLIHNSSGVVMGTATYGSVSQGETSLGGLVPATENTYPSNQDRAQIDNLATYMHLATVVSASERKAASLRWWNAAWSLAREMRLGRELPVDDASDDESAANGGQENNTISNGIRRQSFNDPSAPTPVVRIKVSEEEREERRRAWWLLYMQDRHLALCYNRPMFFLNKECENLLQPLDDEAWQSGRFDQQRRNGLNIQCTSHSIFGYFLPLMVMLGEILDLNHNRNRPRFGPRANQPRNWDETTDEITQQLEMYEKSLREFEATNGHLSEQNMSEAITPSVASGITADSHSTSELSHQTKTVVAYGTHIMHVLHILLTGKWDPIALLDDNDLWISSQSFVTATGHAVSAAEAVADVIEFDPDLSFMPFFFGVYLLQGSFLLLLFADKLQGDVSPDVVKACETIVRAHEACVATLDTQYQRNFRKVMRSALQQVRGRIHEDPTEQQNWRREVLKLYRWTGDGTGLAL